ncbi:MAG TPA: hypothetical protein VFB02_03095 [Bradyrhizobium sp.]|jgi:hypothetical protein|nr:hypothetical protein [Bradyrhizobium sp.]
MALTGRGAARPPKDRNIVRHFALPSDGRRGEAVQPPATPANRFPIEATMATRDEHRIVETPTEARQGEPGPSVAALLAVSLGLAVLVLAVVWFAFFRT